MSPKIPEIKDLCTLLSKYLESDTKIVKYETKSLTAPGENFGSVILAVQVAVVKNGEESILELVAKLCPANELLYKMFNIQESFQKEMYMYMDVIPCLQKFQEEMKVPNNIADLFAKFYGARINLNITSKKVDNDAVLLLENIKIRGYDIGDRLKGFNEEHAHLILRDLALFHGVPIALRTLKPNIFNQVIMPVLKELQVWEGIEGPELDVFIKKFADLFTEISEIKEHINTIESTLRHSMNCEYRDSKGTGPFATIAHTDYWTNNTMISHDSNGKPLKNKIVDLQMVIYQSLIYDLLFFLYTSIQPSVLYGNEIKFINFYYEAFIDVLKQFRLDVTQFSKDAFDTELKRCAFYELGHILVMYKPILTERGAIKDMSDLDLELMYEESSTSPNFDKRLIDCVSSFIKNKWI